MWSFCAVCDDFFVSTRLRFKLDLTPSRETVLHFFEQIGRRHPELCRFRRRDDGGLVLDEDERDGRGKRFIRLDPDTLKVGVCGPADADLITGFTDTVLSLAPAHLSLSDLDYDHMELVLGFDLEYCGNHDELIADALFSSHPLINVLVGDGERVIDFQPFVGVSLSDECDLQAYVEVKSRTSAYEVRCNDYDSQSLSVYLTLRRYWGFNAPTDLKSLHNHMVRIAQELAEERVVPRLVRPLRAAISSRR